MLKIQETSLEELDLWLNFMPGCDFFTVRAGQQALTKNNQRVTVLGFSTNYIDQSKIQTSQKKDLQEIKLTMKYQEKSKVVCLF